MKHIAEQYRPAELQAAIDALQAVVQLSQGETHAIIRALYALGFRIVKTGPQK